MRSRNSRTAALVLTLTMGAALLGTTNASAVEMIVCADASMQGCWTAPFSEDGTYDAAPPATPDEAGEYATAVSAVVLPSGRVVYWDGLSGLEKSNGPLPVDAGRSGQKPDSSRVLDLSGGAPAWSTPDPEFGAAPDNLFCSDQKMLADGRVIVAGGTRYQTEPYADLPDEVADPDAGAPDGLAELYGSANTRVYEDGAEGGTWTHDPNMDMRWRRWYPSLVTLADGKLLAVSGVSKLLWNSNAIDDDNEKNSIAELPVNVKEVETFDPVTNRWTDFANPESEQSLPLYTRLHLLPNGEVLYSGDGQMWGPAGEDINELGWINQKIFDPAAGAWRDVNMGPYGARNGASSLLMPLRPDESGAYSKAEILVSGGTLGVSPGLYLGTTLSEKITIDFAEDGSVAGVASEEDAELNNARWFSTGVLLPNGEAMVFSGADKDEVIQPGTEMPVRTPELYNGTEWVELPDAARDRTYHNSAILLPDGSVLVGGHSPINTLYGPTGDNSLTPLGFANAFRDPSFERYYPPYLYRGERPVIHTAAAAGTYNDVLPFTTPLEADIDKVILSRLPAQTHTVDADQRTVEVTFDPTPGQGQIQNWHANIPDNPAVLPPGYYYLFAMSSEGVPSHAAIVKIDHEVEAAAMIAPVELSRQPARADIGAGVPTRARTSGTTAIDEVVSAVGGSSLPASSEPRLPVALLLGLAAGVGVAARRRSLRGTT